MQAPRTVLVLGALGALLLIASGCAPRSFVRSEPGWKVIELRDGLRGQYDTAWQTTVDTVARNWDIEMMDKESGYIRTAWKHGISGGSYSRYRGRVSVKYPGRPDADRLEVKTEAQWLAWHWGGQDYSWIIGFDSNLQRDVYAALAGRLGRTVPTE
jgi:hypothetical protein